MVLASLKNVSFSYAYSEKRALSDVTLDIVAGQLYGVVGLNASGKSTLCSLIRGIIPHFHEGELEGRVEILGTEVRDWVPAELSREIGYVFQNPFTQISGVRDTVFEEIALGLENLGLARESMIERVKAVLAQLDIESIASANPNELSGGQRQKVAFASIIAMDADFIVIDEPTSQLDPESTEDVFAIIDGLKQAGKSILLVEHKIDLLAKYADRIIVMNAGQVVQEGPTREILTTPALIDSGVPRPEVTQLAVDLADAGRALPRLPITRDEAHELISERMGGTRANRTR